MNFSVLDFFQSASRMPQIAQILVSTFKFSRWACPGPPEKFPLFFLSNSRLWCTDRVVLVARGGGSLTFQPPWILCQQVLLSFDMIVMLWLTCLFVNTSVTLALVLGCRIAIVLTKD